jgi:outer membrane protein assembly factor BamB
MKDITRREALLSGLGTVAGVGGMGTVAAQQDEAQWDIGLPLRQKWSEHISNRYIPAGVTSDFQLILFDEKRDSTSQDRLHVIDLVTGEKEATISFSAYIFDVAVKDGTIAVSLPNEVYATDIEGNELWRDSTSYQEPYYIYSYDRGFLYVGSTVNETSYEGEQVGYYDQGKLVAISTEGDRHFTEDIGFATQFWTTEDHIVARVTNQTDIEGGYEITGGHILCLRYDGTKHWRVDTSPPIQLFIRDPQAIIATTDNTFEVIDIPSGERTNIHDAGGVIDDFVVNDGLIYYQHDNQFKSIEIQDGSEKWSIDTGGKIDDISFYQDALYTGWESGRFDMRDPTDGGVIWEQSLTSENDALAYEWVRDGRLLAFYGNSIWCFIGRKGAAIDRYEQLTTVEGLAIGSRLNQIISGGKLSNVEQAIEDGRYQAALQALDDVERRLNAIDGVLTLAVFGSTYTGSRKSVSTLRHRQLKRKAEQLQSEYPISKGGLEGLVPQETLSQIEVALDSQDSGLLGDRLRTTLDNDTEYDQLKKIISKYVDIAPQVRRVSRNLANLEASDTIRQRWVEEIRSCTSEPDTLANRCEIINELLTRYQDWQEYTTPAFDSLGEEIDTDAVAKAFRAAGMTGEIDYEVAQTYVDAATEFVTAAGESEEALSTYDLSAVLDVARRALNTESSYEGAAQSLSQSAELLETAAEAERNRKSLSLEYTDESKISIKNRLQEAISDLHLSGVQELEEYINHLASGTWKLHQLTSLSPTEFEQLIGRYYSSQGYSTQVTQQSADLGIDIIARGSEEVIAIQAKRYTGSNKVGRPTVQKIVGAKTQVDADRAVVVTTSGFTSTAITAAREFGPQVELIDGDTLVRLLTESPLGPPQSTNSERAGSSHGNTGTEKKRRQSSQSQYDHSQRARCDACGELFHGELRKVTLPDGSTGYCCPRCKQLIDESIGTTGADRRDAASVLGVSPNATDETIEAAYRERVKECHPDTSGGDREEFLRVQEAYKTLTE